MDELTQCHAMSGNKRLMIKVSWMWLSASGGPGPEVGEGHGTAVQKI